MQIPVADLDRDGDLDFASAERAAFFSSRTRPSAKMGLALPYIRVDARDNVAIVLDPEGYTAREHIPQSNKIALKDSNRTSLSYDTGTLSDTRALIPEGSWIRPTWWNAGNARARRPADGDGYSGGIAAPGRLYIRGLSQPRRLRRYA
jgi:hypothetical protein